MATYSDEKMKLSDYNEQMMDYYPEVIKSIREFQHLIGVQSFEVHEMHEKLEAILNNAFVETAEEDRISMWEKFLKITTVHPTKKSKNLCPINKQTISGTSAWTMGWIWKGKLPSGAYVARCKYSQEGTDNTTVALSIRDYDDASTVLKTVKATAQNGTLELPFEVGANKKGIVLYLYSNYSAEALNTKCVFTEIQVEEGSAATEYEEYYESKPIQKEDEGYEEWLTSRRKAILAKLYHVEKLNTKSIEDIVSIFTGNIAESWIIDSTLYVKVYPSETNKTFSLDSIKAELETKCPAHLKLEVYKPYATWGAISDALATWDDVSKNHTWNDIMYYVSSDAVFEYIVDENGNSIMDESNNRLFN